MIQNTKYQKLKDHDPEHDLGSRGADNRLSISIKFHRVIIVALLASNLILAGLLGRAAATNRSTQRLVYG